MAKGTLAADGDAEIFQVNSSANLKLKVPTGASAKLQMLMVSTNEWLDVTGGSWSADTTDIIYSGTFAQTFRLLAVTAGTGIEYEVG